jgi:hypothetical protein
MLQINLQPYASDALEDAMRLAQTKALNSYSFSDCLNYLNYAWMDIYQKIVQLDEGYYSKTVQLTKRLTKLPPFVKNTIRVYAAQGMQGFNREIYRASGYNDLESYGTYHLSGTDLYCPDAERQSRKIWLNYIPQQPMIFFTKNNRDPKLYEDCEKVQSNIYNLYLLMTAVIPGGKKYELVHRNSALAQSYDVTDIIVREGWTITYISCDFPYIFVTYKSDITGEFYSGFFKDMLSSAEWIEYNPFAYTGRSSNVEYYKTAWNDKTGMGVIVKDWSDGQFKELGWTPDTLLIYPSPEVYRYLVALLADKFAALNESNVMGVQKELVEARYAFMNFLKKDKSAWMHIDNINSPSLADLL